MTETRKNDQIAASQLSAMLNPFAAPQMDDFRQTQERVLDRAKEFSSLWVARRRDAADHAMKIAVHMTKSGAFNPAASMRAMCDWQIHSWQRLGEDVRDYAELLTCCADEIVSTKIGEAEDTAEHSKRATETAYALPL